MSREVEVYLGEMERKVGLLRHDQRGNKESASFEYDADWLVAPDAFSIDPTLRLVRGPQFRPGTLTDSVFHGAIADTEPDGWAKRVILRDHAKRRRTALSAGQSVSPVTCTLDFLLQVDDGSRVGALRFRDEAGVFCRAREDGRRTAPPLIELGNLLKATRAVETESETEADLAYLRGHGTSLGGMRPKCTVVDDDGSLSIGKFPSVTDGRAVTKGEVLTLHLAKDAGINAAVARVVESDGIPVALIRRFDRTPDGRIHYVSAATMLGVDATDGVEHAYTEIADALRRYGAAPREDIEELWRRIAFSVLVTNVDDHLNNHGFLHVEHGLWRLAPAFDINPFPDRMRELKTWISEESGPEARIDLLLEAAPHFQLSTSRAREILLKVEQAVAAWAKTGRALGLSARELEQFEDAFEHDERRAAQNVIAVGPTFRSGS